MPPYPGHIARKITSDGSAPDEPVRGASAGISDGLWDARTHAERAADSDSAGRSTASISSTDFGRGVDPSSGHSRGFGCLDFPVRSRRDWKNKHRQKSSAIYNDQVWIPYAVEVDGQIITVYDPGVHRPSAAEVPEDSDKRWVLCHRPRVIAGGELSAEMLDLQYNHGSRYYTGPLQMKANNGVLIMDDF